MQYLRARDNVFSAPKKALNAPRLCLIPIFVCFAGFGLLREEQGRVLLSRDSSTENEDNTPSLFANLNNTGTVFVKFPRLRLERLFYNM
jgi:hypothetical protein